MLRIIKRITISTFFLLLLPSIIWWSGWMWQPNNRECILKLMFLITQTAAFPWGILINLLFNFFILYALRFRLLNAIYLLIIMNSAILVGQCTKSYIKKQVQEPRPYVVWLKENHKINNYRFILMNKQERQKILSLSLKNKIQHLPEWLKNYWIIENGFSFPSGHTIFTTSWVLFVISILHVLRYKIITIIIVFVWANMMMLSRLLLGMHWPKDLLMAILIAWLFSILSMFFAKYFLRDFQYFLKRKL